MFHLPASNFFPSIHIPRTNILLNNMDELIKTFHIDWKLLIAQAINFTIVIVVLGFFALKPLVKIMKEREERIAKGIKDAEASEEKMAEIAKEREAEVKKGRKEAQQIVAKAEQTGEELTRQRTEKAQAEVEKVIRDARQQIGAEREMMVRDVKDELGGLIALALGKITGSGLDEKKHKKLIDAAIEDLKKADLKQ